MIMVSLLIIAATAATFVYLDNENRSRSQMLLEQQADLAAMGLDKAIQWYSHGLFSIRGLFNSSVYVDPLEFRVFSKEILDNYPWISVVSYIEYVTSSRREALVSEMRNYSNLDDAYKNFDIRTNSTRDDYFVVKYSESFVSTSSTIGFDVSTLEDRRRAMERARDDNQWSLSDSLFSLSTGRPGFISYLPIYYHSEEPVSLDDRRKSLQGFAAMTFETNAFFEKALDGIYFDQSVGLTVSEPDRASPIYKNDSALSRSLEKPLFSKRSVKFGGQKWQIEFKAPPGYGLDPVGSMIPFFAVTIGMLLLSFTVIFHVVIDHYMLLVEEEARRAESGRRLLAGLIENTPIGVLISSLSDRGEVILNAAGRLIMGREPAPGLSLENFAEFFDLIREDGRRYRYTELPLWHALASQKMSVAEDVLVRRPDGSVVPIIMSAVAVLDETGSATRLITAIQDVTKERKVERARKEFVSMAAHQMKNPPVAISWCVDSLLDSETGELNQKQAEYLKAIRLESEKMIETVTALLDLSRFELGTFELERKRFDLRELVREETQRIQTECRKGGISLTLKLLKQKQFISGDERLIRVIVRNILDNAVKYTLDGGHVRVVLKGAKGGAYFSVFDTGIGIPEDETSKVFDRFFRATNARKMSASGSGLGLALVKEICDLLGCQIDFTTEEGRGSVFWVVFPARCRGGKQPPIAKTTAKSL